MENLLTFGHMEVNANHLHNLKLGDFTQKWKL
jgi:hypothetical protein